MPDTVLIINGATRINGNTDIIIEKIIEGARSNKTDIRLINLREKKIANCIVCLRNYGYRVHQEYCCTMG